MGLITDNKPPGWYYVGFVTKESLDSMPSDEARKKWPLNTAMQNGKPFKTEKKARKMAEAHHLRDITTHKN